MLLWIIIGIGLLLSYFAKDMREVIIIAGGLSFIQLILGTILGWLITLFQAPISVPFFFSFIFSIVSFTAITLGGWLIRKIKKR